MLALVFIRKPLTNWQLLCWFASGPLIGTGSLIAFGRPYLGAAIGFAVQLLLFVIFLAMLTQVPRL